MAGVITAQDVYDRLNQACEAVWEEAQSLPEFPDTTLHPEYRRLFAEFISWERVAFHVRAGGDPLICVMERE